MRGTYDQAGLWRLWRALQTGKVCVVDDADQPIPPEVFRASGRLEPDAADPDAGTLQALKSNQPVAVYRNPRVAASLPQVPIATAPTVEARAAEEQEVREPTADPDTVYKARLIAFAAEHGRRPDRKEDRIWGQNRKPKVMYKEIDRLREAHLPKELREGGRGVNRIK